MGRERNWHLVINLRLPFHSDNIPTATNKHLFNIAAIFVFIFLIWRRGVTYCVGATCDIERREGVQKKGGREENITGCEMGAEFSRF